MLQSYIRLAVVFATDNAAVMSSVMTCIPSGGWVMTYSSIPTVFYV